MLFCSITSFGNCFTLSFLPIFATTDFINMDFGEEKIIILWSCRTQTLIESFELETRSPETGESLYQSIMCIQLHRTMEGDGHKLKVTNTLQELGGAKEEKCLNTNLNVQGENSFVPGKGEKCSLSWESDRLYQHPPTWKLIHIALSRSRLKEF